MEDQNEMMDEEQILLPTVEAKVRHIVEDLWKPDADYMFYNWAQANVSLDNIKRPVIIYVLPASGSLMHNWYQTTDRPRTQIAFLAKTDFDFKCETNDQLMQAMKILATEFIEQINESHLFVPIDRIEIPYQAVYDYLDENVTGIIITLELRELEGIKHCKL